MSILTSHGDLPFRFVKAGKLEFLAPVCVVSGMTDGKGRAIPQEDGDGNYIYALPGGMRLLADNTVFDPKWSEHAKEPLT